MKNLIVGLIATVLLMTGTAFRTTDDKDKELKVKTSAICEMCKERIERNLAFEKGVKESNLDLNNKVLTVKYNPKKTSPEKIKANISKSGYDADEVVADEKGYNKLPSCCKKDNKEHAH